MSIFIPSHCSGDTCLMLHWPIIRGVSGVMLSLCHEDDAQSFDRPQHNEGLGGAGDVLHNGDKPPIHHKSQRVTRGLQPGQND